MASRYGRNQRRAHREEIARLTEALYGRWARARHGLPDLDRSGIITEVIEQRRTTRHRAEKAVEVTLMAEAVPDAVRAAIDGGRLNFDGFEWLLTSVEQRGVLGADHAVELTMTLAGFTRG